jgi:hypothetical protein
VLGEIAENARVAMPGTPNLAASRGGSRTAATGTRIRVRLWLVVIVVVAAAFRLIVAWRIPVPWVAPDELVHSELARSFAATGHFAIRGEPFSPRSWGPLYLILIAPAFRLGGSLPHAYLIVKAINCVLMSSAAVPAYLLARRLLDRRTALAVAALAVLAPSGIYAARVEAESLAYPLFLFAVLAGISALERPTPKRELIAIAAILLATLARAQFVVLFPAFASAAVILAVFDRDSEEGGSAFRAIYRRLAAYRVSSALFVALAVGVLAVALSGSSFSSFAGGHGEAFGAVDLPQVAKSFALHLAALDLYVGMVPLAALLILTMTAVKRAAPSRELRVFCVATVILVATFAALSAWYLVAVYPDSYLRVYDRYEFYVVPLLLIAFFVWLRDGMPRTAAAPLIAIVLAGLVFAASVVDREAWVHPNAVSFIPWSALADFRLVYLGLAVGGAYLAFLVMRSRNAEWLVVLVAANFLVVNAFAQASATSDSRITMRQGIGSKAEASWIDDAVGADAHVTALWSGTALRGSKGWSTIWESELLNQSVGPVYDLHERLPYDVPEHPVRVRGNALFLSSGRPLRAEYVLTDVSTPVVGRQVAVNRAVGMIVYRVGGPVELRPGGSQSTRTP